jgi:hypothetical protein
VFTREQAARRMEAARTNVPGTCQQWTRNMFGAPSAGDRDHDGDADAVDGWLSEPNDARHPGDRNPPRGVPVAFSGGSRGFGHRAGSLGRRRIRSTDMAESRYARGAVGTTTIDWIERSMGVRYLGWSETITGIPIPTGTKPAPKPKAPKPKKGTRRQVRAATINIPIKVGEKAWEECFRETAARAPYFGVNECLSREQRALYDHLADELGLGHYGLFGPNPVFWDQKKYRRIAGRQYQLHKGRKSKYAGYNAARYATVVVLEDRETGEQVTVVNAHLVPRGAKVPARWRARVRAQSLVKLTWIVQRHVRAGRAVVVMGDTNMDRPPKIPGVRWIAGGTSGVDKIGVALPKRWKVANVHASEYDAPTDHKHGRVAQADLVAA